MGAFGILSYGVYAPQRRIARAAIYDALGWAQPSLKGLARGVRAYCAWDEDAVTMAVEASRAALRDLGAPHPQSLCLATTTAPFLDRQNAGIVAAALDLPSATHVFEAGGSQRAATSALIGIAQSRPKTALLAAGDNRPTKPASPMEMLSGDAGAALVIGEGAAIAEIVGVTSLYADFVDHYRSARSGEDYTLEERWFRDEAIAKIVPRTVGPLLSEAGVGAADVDCLVAPATTPQLASATAKALDIPKDKLADSLFEICGHAGAAHPLLMLAKALDSAKPGALVLVIALGQGCDAILLRTTEAIVDYQNRNASACLDQYREEANYTKFLAARGAIKIDWGMRAERDNRTAQTVAYDKSRDLYGFVGGVCSVCDTPQFPRSRRCVNPDCNALDTQTDYRFADRPAYVKSYTEDWLAFTRDPPLIYGNVSFDGGGNIFMEMTGFAPGDLNIGSPVDMYFRIKDIDEARGFHRYFWKAGPPQGERDG